MKEFWEGGLVNENSSIARKAYNIEDLRLASRRRLPRLLFEFLDRGVDDDIGMQRNRAALHDVALVPRVLNDVSNVDTSATLFGTKSAMPLGISATGGATMFWGNGDVLLARAAKDAGVPFMISGATMTELEKITEVGGRIWYQFYPWRDRTLSYATIDRAQSLGCETLAITVDTAVSPHREYLIRLGFNIPMKASVRTALDVGRKPGWMFGVYLPLLLSGGLPDFDMRKIPEAETMTWDEVREIRKRWKGPVLLKGVVSPADAKRAIEIGCDGVIVSNHGGRNLDHTVPSIMALPRIVDAIGGKGAVLFDSGVRRGSDIIKALALGADFAFAGRATLYGLSAAGKPGADLALKLLREQFARVMAYCGVTSVDQIDRSLIFDPAATDKF